MELDRTALGALTRRAEQAGTPLAGGRVRRLDKEALLAHLEQLRAAATTNGSASANSEKNGSGENAWMPPTPARIESLLALSGLEPLEGEASLSRCRRHPHQARALALLRRFLDEAVAGRPAGTLPKWGIVLGSAETGTGKTYLAMALVADLCRAGIRAQFLPEVEMMRRLRDAQRPDSEFGIANLHERWLRPAVLVVDDLGADKASEFSARELYRLLYTRGRKGRPLVITTNADEPELQEQYDAVAPRQGRRIVSRIAGMCKDAGSWVRMEGPDLRVEAR
jgi:hypothetical protein